MIGSLLLENVQESLTAADVNMTRLRDVKNIVCIAGARYVRDNFSGLVYINPKFNELRGTEVVPGASSHASYQVTETGKSLIWGSELDGVWHRGPLGTCECCGVSLVVLPKTMTSSNPISCPSRYHRA